MLEIVRQYLLHEALKSPALLSDLAGLENYIAESYDSRSFVELLQNADDAGASRFAVQRAGDLLLVANDGRDSRQQILRAFVAALLPPSIEERALVIAASVLNPWWGSRKSFIFSADNLKQLFPAN